MPERRAADLFVACLEREGVEYVFGLPGEETTDLVFALADSDIAFVPVRHEQAAAFMADVHGRLTGDAGVCLSTLGPGATNLITGVADAHLDKSPLVAVTAQAGQQRLHHESHQHLDVVDIFAPITKWNAGVRDPVTVPETVRKAFKVAELEKPGATHVELPEDVAAEPTAAEPLEPRTVRGGDPDPGALEAATDLLAAADRPLLLVGNGVLRARASDSVRAFVAETDLPVVSTYMGKGAVSDASERSLFTLDSGSGEADRAVREADLVVTVGYDIAEHDPEDWNADRTPVVHVDSEPAEVYAQYDPAVEVVCDLEAAMTALADRCGGHDYDTTWYEPLRDAIREGLPAETGDGDETDTGTGTGGLSVATTLPVLRDAMADTDVIVSDVGTHKMVIAREFPTYEPGTCIVSNGLASMGIAVPGGLAADLAVEDEVVVATGDGGFLMNAAELETATRLDCGFTVLVYRDDTYDLITQHMAAERGYATGTDFANPDFVAFAESFGIDAHRADTADELRDAVDDGLDSDAVTLVEVPV